MLSFPGLCRDTLDEAARLLASDSAYPPLQELDHPDNIAHSTNAQLALLIEGVAAARALTRRWHTPAPGVVAGHSVGAFAAAVIAGALTFTEALQAVALRGAAMEHTRDSCASETHRPDKRQHWGMAAVVGIDMRVARQIADQVSTTDNPLWIANINSRRQIVFSGTRESLGILSVAAERSGAQRVEQLAVGVASHCPLQQPVRNALAKHLSTVPERPLTATYLTNTRGRRARTSRDILTDLVDSVAQPIHWRTIVELLPELGVSTAVEMPPDHILTHLASDQVELNSIAVAGIGLESTAQMIKLNL